MQSCNLVVQVVSFASSFLISCQIKCFLPKDIFYLLITVFRAQAQHSLNLTKLELQELTGALLSADKLKHKLLFFFAFTFKPAPLNIQLYYLRIQSDFKPVGFVVREHLKLLPFLFVTSNKCNSFTKKGRSEFNSVM